MNEFPGLWVHGALFGQPALPLERGDRRVNLVRYRMLPTGGLAPSKLATNLSVPSSIPTSSLRCR